MLLPDIPAVMLLAAELLVAVMPCHAKLLTALP
jgi:hypothetical protein